LVVIAESKGLPVMRVGNVHLPATPLLLAMVLLFHLSSLAQAPVPRSQHVVLVMDENTSYSTTLSAMPWLVSQGSANG
jgi:hypothetical protein